MITRNFSKNHICFYYGQFHAEKLKTLIRENTSKIDDILCSIIDPEKRTIDRAILIEQYDYPDVNLGKIDLEWEVENA